MNAKVTRWFNLRRDGRPARHGWYDVRYHSDPISIKDPVRRFFDGYNWRYGPGEQKCMFGNQPSDFRYEFWRGLADRPTAQGAGDL